jgi:polar amino acid transport system permease protein
MAARNLKIGMFHLNPVSPSGLHNPCMRSVDRPIETPASPREDPHERFQDSFWKHMWYDPSRRHPAVQRGKKQPDKRHPVETMKMNTIFHMPAGVRRTALTDSGKFFLLAGLVVWLLTLGTQGMAYHWQWYRVPRYLFTTAGGVWKAGPLLQGLGITLEISLLSLLCTLIIGLTAALFRLSDSFTARALARSYLELIRNTPLLIQIFFVYFVVSPVLDIGAFASAVLALSLFEGAYAAEILRAGIVSLHRGQWEAAHSLGLGVFDTYRDVILPQAVRRVLPPLAGQGISLIKDSSLVSTIAIYDLTMQGQKIVAETFLAFEIWFTVAAIYLVITFSLSFAVRALENRMNGLPIRGAGGIA